MMTRSQAWAMFAVAAHQHDRSSSSVESSAMWADKMLVAFDERFSRVPEAPLRERAAAIVEAAANVDTANARVLAIGFQNSARAAYSVLANTATDLDAAQARLLEIAEQVNGIGGGNATEVKAITDVATSLGDISVVCNRAAKEARR